MQYDLRKQHNFLSGKVLEELKNNSKKLRVKKKTISNLFRYEDRLNSNNHEVDLSSFNKPLYLDKRNQILEVQGMTTYEDIVDFVLPEGLLPMITPELKHITIGGAIVGIGIESNSYRYGFVHDSLIEVNVLVSDGRILKCSEHKNSDLFYGLPNSYGTLGYVLSAKIKLRRVKPFVELTTQKFTNINSFLNKFEISTKNKDVDYIESLIYSKDELYLITSKHTNKSNSLKSIYGQTIFYKLISKPGVVTLRTKDYIFRYDPEWFWAIPESLFYSIYRRMSPKRMRNSSFYTRYINLRKLLNKKTNFIKFEEKYFEHLIQDWEVTWDKADKLLSFTLQNIGLVGKPIMLTGVKSHTQSTLYPMKTMKLYANLGSYGYAQKQEGKEPFYNTKIMDKFCFDNGGIKMLYSSTFISKSRFDKIYNGNEYRQLKNKYDKLNLLPTLFEKAVKRS